MGRRNKTASDFFMGPMRDIIPNEIINDTFRLSVWLGLWMGMFGMLSSTVQKVDKDGNVINTSENRDFIGFLERCAFYTNIPYAAYKMYTSGETAPGIGQVVLDLVYTPPDFTALKSHYTAGTFPHAVLTIVEDPFYRNAILAAGFASLGTYVTFETKLIENLPPAVLSNQAKVSLA